MGGAAFKELRTRKDKYHTVLILRPSKVNKKNFKEYENEEGVVIVWGDLTKFEDVKKAVTGCDYVLHPAAFIAPEADAHPQVAKAVNTGGAINLVNAIKEQPNGGDNIRFVNIGTVAEYGDRLPPIHMVKVGDPFKPSVGDFYATTKIAGERAVIESGLKWWASMRQTFICIPNLMSLMDPIAFHQPPRTCIEFITAEDTGFGLVETMKCPDDFYGRVYNIGGGPACRVTYFDFLERTFRLFGLDAEKIMPRNWFGIRNFHCNWWADSDVLNNYTHHQRHSFEDYMKVVEKNASPFLRYGGKLGGKIPGVHSLVRELVMKRYADPLHWIQKNEVEKIKAFFGSREAWENIGSWKDYDHSKPGTERVIKPYEGNDWNELAKSRGGQCLKPDSKDPTVKTKWKCGFGHEFEATPRLVRTGHWCPQCTPPAWHWDEIAKVDPLFASVWYPNHSKDENQVVDWLYCPNE